MNLPGETILHSARLVSGGLTVEDGWVLFSGDTIVGRGTGDSWRSHPADEVVDVAGRLLTPGFIDLHCHGGGGASVEDGAAAISTLLDAHTAHGTTRTVLSLVSADLDVLEQRLGVIRSTAAEDPRVLGAHLEGPFLAEAFRGAHDPRTLRDPAPEAVERLLAAGSDALRQITIDPERPHALDAIERFASAGVTVAVGHTGADADAARAAFARGATLLTHAFNAMRGIHHRAPGPILAALDDPDVIVEAICDGVHLHPDVIRLLFDLAPGRVALVTDAMAAAGASDGEYQLGSMTVTVTEGVAHLSGSDVIAGSTLTQDVALRRAVQDARVGLEAAVSAVTETPAAALGLDSRLGRLDPGYAADAVILDDSLEVAAVFSAGRRHR